jgi:hypothetical protein
MSGFTMRILALLLCSPLVLAGCNSAPDLTILSETKLSSGKTLSVGVELDYNKDSFTYYAEIGTAISNYLSTYTKKNEVAPSLEDLKEQTIVVDGNARQIGSLVDIDITSISVH